MLVEEEEQVVVADMDMDAVMAAAVDLCAILVDTIYIVGHMEGDQAYEHKAHQRMHTYDLDRERT